jgi:RAB protein geranylgeranyltransferase component A
MAGELGDTVEIHRPSFKFEWNLNTVVVLIGFAGGFVAWGYTVSDLMTAKANAIIEVGKLWSEVKRLDESNRRFDNIEYRVNIVENQARISAQADIDQTQKIAEIASDVRVTREILERLERARTPSVK